MLDTNVCIRLLKGDSPLLLERIENIHPENVFIPSIVRFELYYGAYKSNIKEKTLIKLSEFLNSFEVTIIDEYVAKVAGKIRAELDKQGLPIGPYDLLIGASALVNNYILVTHNTKEFIRIKDIKIEDWESLNI